jgi:hypothetical protein
MLRQTKIEREREREKESKEDIHKKGKMEVPNRRNKGKRKNSQLLSTLFAFEVIAFENNQKLMRKQSV